MTAIMMYKAMTNQVPHRRHVYNTRQSNLCVDITRPKTESGKCTFMYRGAQVWNSLSEDIQRAPSIGIFKSKLTKSNNA